MKKLGMTLMEVLLALVILGLALGMFAPSVVGSMQANADNRTRAQAVAAAEGWLDRFRAKTLDFNAFTTARTYDYGYDYANDPTFVAAGDPSPASLNAEWGRYAFRVQTTLFASSPQVWRVDVTIRYARVKGGEASFALSTFVDQ
ncbi:type IV pilus modification PilV family protein [Calidithermus chliarophilus]|uniref:type IV pilus modification PilV family protein n=1 Tax=Calidithermus chliarophilus TaxID=52023 RepID=UPI0003FCB1AD|nr:type II secretion system protein [Calidithermus chliarophilus]